jgi:hypothetical protein
LSAVLHEVWTEHGFRVLRLAAVWAGPHKMTVATKVCPADQSITAAALIGRINAAEAAVRARVPEVTMQFSEPDHED